MNTPRYREVRKGEGPNQDGTTRAEPSASQAMREGTDAGDDLRHATDPIFIDTGFGHVEPSDGVGSSDGVRRRLTDGATVAADASAEEFARPWATILSERPEGPTHWEYAAEWSRSAGFEKSDPLPLEQALDLVRTSPGTRLLRRPVGRWEVVPSPFPSFEKPGWDELEPEKHQWLAAFRDFPPVAGGIAGRMGTADQAPAAWIELAHRAATVGFSPQSYQLLGTALTAWKVRDATSPFPSRDGHELKNIEIWAQFPDLIRAGESPLGAIRQIVRNQR